MKSTSNPQTRLDRAVIERALWPAAKDAACGQMHPTHLRCRGRLRLRLIPRINRFAGANQCRSPQNPVRPPRLHALEAPSPERAASLWPLLVNRADRLPVAQLQVHAVTAPVVHISAPLMFEEAVRRQAPPGVFGKQHEIARVLAEAARPARHAIECLAHGAAPQDAAGVYAGGPAARKRPPLPLWRA